METIMTVYGPIPVDKIGLTSMHDQILINPVVVWIKNVHWIIK